ncbi:DHH family phosphoesterase [Brucepastera parasyntrophica]|uniref:DHH family phosphoesterase n=1 Tax=Brucepastera parasyntrophica TaxID=2880008 RepID=UPI00210E43EC|nr:DHH family phosphoesterase [Brucepastera parasyntrophica]ULQ60577.1 DHH family phosphoesterase [Brucepastera parasyntrophica]
MENETGVFKQSSETQNAGRRKHDFRTIAEKNRTIDSIIHVITENDSFLMLGHKIPDEDCIASMVSMGIIITKFNKNASLYLRNQIPETLEYLKKICTYNNIQIFSNDDILTAKPDVICVLDTPKPAHIDSNPSIMPYLTNKRARVIEFDHHLAADAEYCGDEGYCFVARASSTCEILGHFCCKLDNKPDVVEKYDIRDLFSRNLVLSILTGMIGDTKYGLTLKSNREIFFYNLFCQYFAEILKKTYRKNSGNYSSLHEIYKTLQGVSEDEKEIYLKLLEKDKYAKHIHYVVLNEEESRKFDEMDQGLFIKTIKAVTDFLAEKSGTFGMAAYYDKPEISDLIQFRVRTAGNVVNIDLRDILATLSLTDGGGHPGAIAFRVQKKK